MILGSYGGEDFALEPALLSTLKRLMPDSQIIMITAHNSPELAQGAMVLGAFRVITSRSKWTVLPRSWARPARQAGDGKSLPVPLSQLLVVNDKDRRWLHN